MLDYEHKINLYIYNINSHKIKNNKNKFFLEF